MKAATVIPADAVSVHMEAPLVIDQGPPDVKEWGKYRMPKVYRMPTGELCLTYQTGRDHYCDQGITSPAFLSTDQGRSWRPADWPHPAIKGMNPFMTPVNNGEYLCVPVTQGIRLEMDRMPKPVGEFSGYAGFSLYRLDECPDDVIRWFKDIKGVRWSPATRTWKPEKITWDHAGQLVWVYNDTPQKIPGHWSQNALFQSHVLRRGNELLFADYWTQRLSAAGRVPLGWECTLMVSKDNGRSWARRSIMADIKAGDGTGEPTLELNQAGEIVGVLRRDFGETRPMYLVHSKDGGHTWTEPQTLFENGVFPWLLQLENGVMALVFGRPGVKLSFSLDGGHSWTQPRPVIDDPTNGYTSCGNTCICAVGRDSLVVGYNHVAWPNAKGEPCKTILSRRVTVKPA